MFYRRTGIRHTRYAEERRLWPLRLDRNLVIAVVALLLIAPFVVDRLYLTAYLLPWLIWSSATIQVPPVRFLGARIEGDLPTYFFALLVCAVITSFMLNVGRTSFGRALAAVREKDYAAEIIGIDTFRFKLLAFWVSSFIGGVVGAVLVVCYLRSVSPDQFHLDLSVQIVAMVIVGGLGS